MLRTTITASHAQLAELTIAVLDHYSDGKSIMPETVRMMFAPVCDALVNNDNDYKDLMHALFSIVIEEQGLLSDPKVQEAAHG